MLKKAAIQGNDQITKSVCKLASSYNIKHKSLKGFSIRNMFGIIIRCFLYSVYTIKAVRQVMPRGNELIYYICDKIDS